MNFYANLAMLYTRSKHYRCMDEESERKDRMKKVLEKERKSNSLPQT